MTQHDIFIYVLGVGIGLFLAQILGAYEDYRWHKHYWKECREALGRMKKAEKG